jgi:hypothetical protein
LSFWKLWFVLECFKVKRKTSLKYLEIFFKRSKITCLR